MASHFGEVVYPSSRAFWDEDEDEESFDDSHISKLEINWITEKPTIVKTLLIVESDLINDFITHCLLNNSSKICEVKNEKKQNFSTMYKLNDDNAYLYKIDSGYDVKMSGEFIEMISDILTLTQHIIAVTSYHMSKYIGYKSPQVSCFFRKLHTSNERNILSQVELLEQPNIVHGIGAGVLTYADVFEKSATLFILYIDSFTLESDNAELIAELFSKMLNQKITDMKYSDSKFFNKGNLYMYNRLLNSYYILHLININGGRKDLSYLVNFDYISFIINPNYTFVFKEL